MSYTDLTPENRITVFNQSIHNALSNPELSSRLSFRGYPEEKLLIGKSHGVLAQQKYNKQVSEYGEYFAASELYSTESKNLREDIKDLRTIARVIFREDRQARQDLKLNKELSRTFGVFYTQVSAMINNALKNTNTLEQLTAYGYDEAALTALSTRLAALPEIKEDRDRENTEAQEATKERDEAIEIMDKWFVDLLTIAPIAVKDKPELMELLNVVVK